MGLRLPMPESMSSDDYPPVDSTTDTTVRRKHKKQAQRDRSKSREKSTRKNRSSKKQGFTADTPSSPIFVGNLILLAVLVALLIYGALSMNGSSSAVSIAEDRGNDATDVEERGSIGDIQGHTSTETKRRKKSGKKRSKTKKITGGTMP